MRYIFRPEARCSVVGGSIMLQAGRSRIRFPMRGGGSLIFLNFPNLSRCAMAPRSTQWNVPREVKSGRRVRLTTLPLSVSRLSRDCNPRRLTTLWASTSCCKGSFSPSYLHSSATHIHPQASKCSLVETGILH
jgi:hypothetical protein